MASIVVADHDSKSFGHLSAGSFSTGGQHRDTTGKIDNVELDDLNDWQRSIYMAIAERGPLTEREIVRATILPAKEVRPIVEQLTTLGAIYKTDNGWRIT
jgi:hypothetical protein